MRIGDSSDENVNAQTITEAGEGFGSDDRRGQRCLTGK
jgi:hypothetical protein